jgi:hypothetical protein
MELDPKYDQFDFPTTSVETREGHPGHLTPAQQAQVHQLRMMLESEGFKQHLDTLTLVRESSSALFISIPMLTFLPHTTEEY